MCPHCLVELEASTRYGEWIGFASVVLAFSVATTVGFRGLHLAYATLAIFIVADILLINLFRYVVPPQVFVASPPKSFREIVRETMGPTELNLRDKDSARQT